MNNDLIVGIDLGTSTTEIAVIKDGKPMLLSNSSGMKIIPSVVGLDDEDNWVAGERARAQLLLSPEKTAAEIKRLIGSGELVALGSRTYTPVELSAKLLEYVKTFAAQSLGEEITKAVISVPAYFDEIKRQETVLAGQLAGLTIERILNEPTAAALSYGLEHLDEESHVLVYDLGGGTFDVTLLEMFEGVLEVKASGGDNKLGGKDFDERLIEWMAQNFLKKTGVDLKSDVYAMSRLKEEAERCKKELSEKESVRINIPFIAEKQGRPLSISEELTREQFERMTADLLERTHAPIRRVLFDSGLSASDIDKVILVGGSTRMTAVSKDIRDFLNIIPEPAVDPDLAVAEGAAIQAGIIGGVIDNESSLVFTDVNPYSLGIRTVYGITNDHMSVLIRRNTTIPVTKKDTFRTTYDYQNKVDIEVYQGESEIASHNHFLGSFHIKDVPERKAGREKIEVDFSYDLNGMLRVEAIVLSTGRKASIDIDMIHAREN